MNSGVLPNFILIGGQRCASSWIYQCLKGHPDIYLPYIKELNYFDKHYAKGIEWYKKYFEMHKDEKAIGDATPSYLFRKEAPARISETIPDVKLIACLRNPIDRAFSQYKKQIISGRISMSFEMAIDLISVFVEKGFYYEQIERYLKLFPREKMLILIYEDIKEDPVKFMQSIFRFLGVDPDVVPPGVDRRVQPDMLTQFGLYNSIGNMTKLMKSAGMGRVIEIIKKAGFKDLLNKILYDHSYKIKKGSGSNKEHIPDMSPETRAGLVEIYREHNDRLSDFLGRDLSFWR